MPRPLAGQVVVVTGASSGIGLCTARAFAAAGAALVATARSRERLDALVEEIVAAGGRACSVPADVRDPEAMQEVARVAVDRFGRIDTWVNNAGVGVIGWTEQVEPAVYDTAMRTNYLGQVHGVLAALPRLRAAGGGVIVGVSSVEGARGVPLQAAYAASKWALRGFYEVLRMELEAASEPIAVTVVLPAAIDTPFYVNARSHTGWQPKPPPLVYVPEVVARAIVRAAEHPTRDVVVGGSGLGFLFAERFAPRLADRAMSSGDWAFRVQRSSVPAGGDGLDAPLPGLPAERSGEPVHALRHSAYTAAVGDRPAVRRALLLAALAGFAAVIRSSKRSSPG
jgi:NADP-dependent 3-hydroxy acid dehydrogenase YdfG